MVDPTESVKPGRPVVIWRVDVAFLDRDDWKYETSKAGAGRGGRTHTFGVKSPAEKLRDAAVYVLDGIELKGGRPVIMDELERDSAPPNKLGKKIK